MSRCVLVTGATGFLGTAISDVLAADGWTVIHCARRPPHEDGRKWRSYDLTQSVPDTFLADVDVVVHAGYIERKHDPNAYAANVAGTKQLIAAARAAAARFIFISSLSAGPAARSDYGRQKFAIEGLLDPKRDLIVRPGLVLGGGGIFGRLLGHVRSGLPIPLVDGGQQPLQTIHINDLTAAVRELVSAAATGSVVLAETPAVPYASFFRELATRAGVKTRLISVPSWLLLAFADTAAALRVPSPIDRDNVLGLLDMHYVEPTSTEALGLTRIRNFAESLDALFAAPEESARR